ncbi:hypothetical protein NPIL_310381 [Nephila pilipes]|uniref:Uncharacterized protein n=1 Tax=Nephila pilipes TaxID=299642 RepID=A0A8X6MZ84_NEPPI|nr:hypothetical protein NPIL_310381 [Nephila pilipes]
MMHKTVQKCQHCCRRRGRRLKQLQPPNPSTRNFGSKLLPKLSAVNPSQGFVFWEEMYLFVQEYKELPSSVRLKHAHKIDVMYVAEEYYMILIFCYELTWSYV